MMSSKEEKGYYDNIINKLKEFDQLYENEKGSNKSSLVDEAVRVEQGEYIIIKIDNRDIKGIGTHHVNPCIVICIKTDEYYGMIHFDSYSTESNLKKVLDLFTGKIKEVIILGGKIGSEALRSGHETMDIVVRTLDDYVNKNQIYILYKSNKGETNDLEKHKQSLENDTHIDCIFYSNKNLEVKNLLQE